MVTTAFLFFTVSTLAAQINAVPTNDIIHDPCAGKTRCFEKPADYPQDKMDRIVAQFDLDHLHRIKREAQLAFRNSNKKDECVETSTMDQSYKETDVNNVTRLVVQSKNYKQMIPKITCRTGKTCHASLRIGFKCTPVITRVSLMMTTEEHNEAATYPVDIVTGCLCAKSIPNIPNQI